MGPSGEFADDGSAVIECKIPQDEREAEEWAERTLVFRTRPLGSEKMVLVDAGAMLSAEEMMREEDASDAVCLYLHQAVSETIDLEETMNPDWVMGEGFSFRVGHQMADGMGAYILAGDFLKFFAEQLGGRSEKKFDWGTASNNVPEPWVRMMNANQQTCGEEFEDNVKKNTHLVLETIVRAVRLAESNPQLT